MAVDSSDKMNINSFGPGIEVEDFRRVSCPACYSRDARFFYSINRFECEGCGYSGSASVMHHKYEHMLSLHQEEPEPVIEYSEDDTGNAKRFRDKNKGQVLYSHPEKAWRYYNGQYWKRDESGEIKRRADRVVEEMAANVTARDAGFKERLRFIAKTRSSSGKENMLAESRHLEGLYCDPDEFDKNPYLINMKNGTYHLLSDAFIDHDPEDMITKMADVRFDEDAKCPLWEKTIHTVLNNDPGRIRYFKQLCGYCMTGLIREQNMVIPYGLGRNGKTLVMETIKGILGDYAISANPDILMSRDKTGGATPEIVRLRGARLVLTSETQDGARLNEGLIKQLTGGDTIVARPLYSNEIQFKPQFKLFMVTNYKPVIRGQDEGIWRRIHLLPFDVTIPKEEVDPDLALKLKNEWSGILNWMIEGFRDYIQNGLIVPEAVKSATDEYRSENDIFAQFWEDCIQDDEGGSVTAAEMYTCYRIWCEKNGIRYSMNQIRFGREANRRAESERTRYGKRYPGIVLSALGESLFNNSA